MNINSNIATITYMIMKIIFLIVYHNTHGDEFQLLRSLPSHPWL